MICKQRRYEPVNALLAGFILLCIFLCAVMIIGGTLYPPQLAHGATSPPSVAYVPSDPSEWLPTADARQVETGGYWLAYDGRSRTARYVIEVLTPKSLVKHVDRASGFKADPTAPPEARAIPADYVGSGFDQGHLAPAADWMTSDKLQSATFLLSNVAPQVPSCNRGVWKLLETHVRDVASSNDVTIVVTAPLYLPDSAGRFTVATVGKNGVWVPTHFGKAICVFKSGDSQLAAWIVPNTDDTEHDPHCYQVTVDAFESASGLDVFAPLPDAQEKPLEAKINVVPEPD